MVTKKSVTQKSPQDVDALFKAYLEVCNKAMDANKDRFPYKHIWEAVEKVLADKEIEIRVIDDQPKAAYTLRIGNHHIEIANGEKHSDDGWKVSTSYLKEVVEHPEEYIRNPAKIDWEWLRYRLR
ncbi:MAG: hypothetical protein H6908_01745 [Hyphomicrobiales bacterium]|nr:hypothetical protein [Rickettsiales bacterium]MCP5361356.1 hypothetical protein [Hyphomicrobiales bacterium]